jgi:transposase
MGMADIKEILVAWDAGESVSAIARRLGYTRLTVRKYGRAAEHVGLVRGGGRRAEAEWDRLAQAAVARVARRGHQTPAADEIAHHRDYLERWVGTIQLSVLHQRLRDEHGLRASWRSFHRYAWGQWPARLTKQPRATIRLADPPPGEEAQVDFFYLGLWDDPEAHRRRRAFCFQMTLSHSRHQFVYPVVGEDSAAWLEAHVAAFAFFEGVPRRVVPDNLTAGITTVDLYDPRVNRAYGELARHYGFLVDPARAAHPKDKPRVERAGHYTQHNCFAGRLEGTLSELRALARRWCLEVAGRRRHGTTGAAPLAAFRAREQAALLPLPAEAWERAVWTTATLQHDCHLRAGAAEYSAPYRLIGRRLDVRLGERLVLVYDGTTLVASHARQARGGRATQLDHYPPAGQAYLTGHPEACRQQAAAIGPQTERLVTGLLTPFLLTRLREVQALLRLAAHYPAARLERACQLALDDGDGRYRTVRGLLERGLDQVAPAPVPAVVTAPAYLRGPAAFALVGVEVAPW